VLLKYVDWYRKSMNIISQHIPTLGPQILIVVGTYTAKILLPSGKHTKKLWNMDENGPLIVDLPIRNADFQ
jgi:hypothetical protein